MTLVSQSVDFYGTAEASLAKARNATPLYPTRNALDVSVALKCISSYQVYATDPDLQRLDDEAFAAPLIGAARTLQSVAQYLRIEDALRPDEANDLYLHAAIAHAMCGNSPSAAAALREVDGEYQIKTPLRCMAAVICNPNAKIATQRKDPVDGIGGFRSRLFKSLRELDIGIRTKHFELLLEIIANKARDPQASVADKSYVLSMIVAARQAFRLATASLATEAPAIPKWFIENSIDAGILTLLPPQRQLLCSAKLAEKNSNALLTLPTSTGKTFIAEACISTSANSYGICVYIAPYVAIGEQVRQSLEKKKFHDHVQVVSMFGGFKTESVAPKFERAVIIATPERFDAWMRTTTQLASLRLVVFDEVHIIENDVRGSRVEGLLSRLRLLQNRMPELRILGLSAVLSNSEALEKWMNVGPEGAQKMGWRPTARRLATCDSTGRLQWIHGNDALRPEGANPDTAITFPVQIQLPANVYPARNINSQEGPAAQNVAAVALDLLHRLESPGLIVCPRRSDTRFLARELSKLLPKVQSNELTKIASDLRDQHNWLNTLADCLEHGVAYHNASLPFDVRRTIEGAIRAHHLKLVCSTTTLAEGADFPFRWTLVSHWLSSFRGEGTAMKSITFRNIAGRCGRAGAFTEGDTVLFENTIGPIAAFAPFGKRPHPDRLTKVIFSSAPVNSTIGREWSEEGSDQAKIRAAFSSQLLACIREHPLDENIAESFAAATYSAHLVGSKFVTEVIEDGLRDILNSHLPGGALAERNSPVRLTPLGTYANQSGFAPASVRRMMNYLLMPTPDWYSSNILPALLIEFSNLDEQSSYILRKVVNSPNHRFPMKTGDLSFVISQLILGKDVREVFDNLPGVKKSTAQPDYLEAKFDEFVTFVETSIWGFLPWLLHALALFAPFAHDDARNVSWQEWAKTLDRRSPTRGDDSTGESEVEPF